MTSSTFVVSRRDISAIQHVLVGNDVHHLGEHRDFRHHHLLSEFLPSVGRVSLSWTKLTKGEELAVHQHPTKSMIIVTKGSGQVLGGGEPQEVKEGDVIDVPEAVPHGFTTKSELVALSVQFEGVGLYENEKQPQVEFTESYCKRLNKYQDDRFAKHVKTDFFQLLTDGTLDDPKKKMRFMSCLHHWSSVFQRLMFIRQDLTYGKVWENLFLQHFHEEFGHDDMLAKDMYPTEMLEDPEIKACASWFLSRMITSDNLERLVIVHGVLERSAHAFHTAANHLFSHDYFEAYAHADDVHQKMGETKLNGINQDTYERLHKIAGKSWDIFELMLYRMARLVKGA